MANGAYRPLKASLSAVLKHVVCIVYLITCCAVGDNAHNIMYNACVTIDTRQDRSGQCES